MGAGQTSEVRTDIMFVLLMGGKEMQRDTRYFYRLL